MRVQGRIFKDGKFWLAEVPILDAMTQGSTRKDEPPRESRRVIGCDVSGRREACPRESGGRIRRGNAPHNLGVIRHVAVNLLKRESTKISVRKKRIRVALNDGFRDKVLMGQPFYMQLP